MQVTLSVLRVKGKIGIARVINFSSCNYCKQFEFDLSPSKY